MEFSFGAVRLH